MVHPSIFVGSLLTGVLLKVGTESVEESLMIYEIEKISDYFCTITSNLLSNYTYASDCIKDSFSLKNTCKVQEALRNLIEGYGKDNKGSWQKFFDERDSDLKKIE